MWHELVHYLALPAIIHSFSTDKRSLGPVCVYRHALHEQALILAAYPFFPMGTVFVAPFLILSFKFEKQLLTTFQVRRVFLD